MMPTFLIVGAAKCGTTSVYEYLRQHPEVYVSPVKEPKFFSRVARRTDFGGPGDQDDMRRHTVTSLGEYRSLFRDAPGHRAVGEASTLYLYDPTSPDEILNALPSVKIVAILRHPVERAYSNFLYMVRRGNEPLRSFADALAAEDQRVADNWMPSWHYRRRGLYGDQVERYLRRFDRQQIRFYLYDDLVEHPARLLKDLFGFLGIDDTFQPDISGRHNVSGLPRNKRLHAALAGANGIKALARPFLPHQTARRLAHRLRMWNLTRPRLPEAVRDQLAAFYRSDILRLQQLLERDLTAWLA